MRKLTAVMIVRNEEHVLPGCLDSLAGVADALVVVDTGSEDGTLALLAGEAERGRFERVEVARHPFDGFGPSRRRALKLADTDWILWIDADERLSPTLRRELSLNLDDGSIEANDLWRIPFDTYVLGRLMTARELAGQRHVRLFRRGRADFTPSAVHEGLAPAPDATIGYLTAPITHHTMTSWNDYMHKALFYARLEAGTRSRLYAAVHLPIAFLATFWRQYVWRGLWRDGWPGFVWAFTSGVGTKMRDWWTLTKRRD